jgi:hypothetical protein
VLVVVARPMDGARWRLTIAPRVSNQPPLALAWHCDGAPASGHAITN